MTSDFGFIHNNRTADWGLNADVLHWLEGALKPGMVTVETGAGASTILFAKKGCRHTCITPSKSEIDKIAQICGEEGIALSDVEFVNAFSQDVVPQMNGIEPDVVLIDGGHGFPIPSIYFFYLGRQL